MIALLCIIPMIGSIIGGLSFLDAVVRATSLSAPQLAAECAMALSWAIIPYVFAKSVFLFSESGRSRVTNIYLGKISKKLDSIVLIEKNQKSQISDPTEIKEESGSSASFSSDPEGQSRRDPYISRTPAQRLFWNGSKSIDYISRKAV